ncbi:ribonuclease HII [Brachybacterium sp. P6-10-X1]|uniref:ribonuclease HII n=1 Tax=Brachybacterium sp. P6-10-X1 TaxID=1903186 RepID=UPI000971770E|nr:ribonuclease HII [Brachybacterium sp. P6-10-X1]APX34415.1 ribonuclease HII [Brachybacterium sp. P6-10-X1]
MTVTLPTLDLELALAARCGPGRRLVVGLDEVGRGALAGPVAMGACALEIVDGRTPALPEGVRDSKKLSPRRREALVEPILKAVHAGAVGWAGPAEIDEFGIVGALTRAGLRALEGLGVEPDAILLDGDADVLSAALVRPDRPAPVVELRVAADRDCASVSAASVLAKVARDAHMVELDGLAPEYCWASNKGYGSAAHREAIDRLGVHEHHRRSWRLGSAPGAPVAALTAVGPAPAAAEEPAASAAPVVPTSVPAPAPSPAGVLWSDQWPLQHKEERR